MMEEYKENKDKKIGIYGFLAIGCILYGVFAAVLYMTNDIQDSIQGLTVLIIMVLSMLWAGFMLVFRDLEYLEKKLVGKK